MKKIVIMLVIILSLWGCSKNSVEPSFGNIVEITQDDVDKGNIKVHDSGALEEPRNSVKEKEIHEEVVESSVEPIIFDISNNRSISVEKDKPIIFSLESNPTTGYCWDCEIHDETKLKLINQDYIIQGNIESLGQGGRQYFKFKSLSYESSVIIFKYSRAPEDKPRKTFRAFIDYK